MKRTMLLLLASAMCALLATPAHAVPLSHVITFDHDSSGSKPNGWQSVDSSITSFSDSIGADLDVNDYGYQSHGQALAVNFDDQSHLIMTFSVPVCQIKLSFGNDDPGFSNPGDLARLRVSSGGNVVGMSAVLLNRDDIMNQRISIGGVSFDQAEFWYDVTTNGLIEIVDRIGVTPC